MPRRNKHDLPMTPDLEKFKYEVAEEIGITGRMLSGKNQNDQTTKK